MNYANLKKSELVALLEQRDARLVAAVDAYRALQAQHKAVAAHVHTTKKPVLKAVKSFPDKESLLAWAGDNISKFIITHNAVSGELLASIREWK